MACCIFGISIGEIFEPGRNPSMDLELDMKHRIIRKLARGFVERELGPIAPEVDREARFPWEVAELMKPLGYFGLQIPPSWEGAGLDTLGYALVVEEVSRVCAAMGLMISVHNSVAAYPLWRFGTDAQRERFLRPLARGDRIGSFCLTEPNAGSDANAVETTAAVDGDAFILNGNKIFVTNGSVAGIALVFARTSLTGNPREVSVLIVETDTEGCTKGPQEDLCGMRGNPVCYLVMNDCRVPRDNLLGQPGQGLRMALASLDGGRIGISAQALGIAQACLEASLQYAKERVQFGRPIGTFQAIQSKLADMAVEVEAARLLTYRAACDVDLGKRVTLASAMAKLFSSRVSVRAALEAVQIYGGYGYTRAYPVERYLRDAKVTEIYEGTSEVQQMVICRDLLWAKRRDK
jgi:butyryl-CoA dehydrogenase